MSYKIPDEVLEYISLVESAAHPMCPEQQALSAYIRSVFEEESIYVDEKQLKQYMGLTKYFPFKTLFPWERFLVALWDCTYREDGFPRWKTLFCMVGRGAGKDGLIAFDSFASVSPYNPVVHYDVDICANNEEQAKRPVQDVIEALETPGNEAKLNRFYYHTKEVVQGRKNKG